MSTFVQICPDLNATYEGNLLLDKTVVQFQNIKYAEIPARWEEAKLITKYANATTFRCTDPGPQCPQPTQNGDEKYFGIPPNLRIPTWHEQSEFDCLSLKITRPAQIETPYPVMLFIHGGANVGGTAYNPVHDPANLVKYSISINRPIVVVNANYRLGYLGLLTKNQTANFTLRDLKLCIQWVKKNIKQFGGDPDNICMVGESAGSMNIHALAIQNPEMHLDVKRISLISGTLGVPAPVSLDDKMKQMDEIKHQFKTDDLLSVDAEVLSRTSSSKDPIVDDGFMPKPFDLQKIAPFKQVLMIDCRDEYVALDLDEKKMAKTGDMSELEKSELGRELKKAYKITGNTIEDWKKLLFAYGDLVFAAAAMRLYQTINSRSPTSASYIYYDLPNPYDESLGAHHSLPLMMLFGNYPMDHKYFAQGEKLRAIYVDFLYGIVSWTSDSYLNFTPEAGKDITKLINDTELSEIRNTKGWEVISKYPLAECYALMRKIWH